ncbi:MAG: GNAT family N-acetyltransferase [Candidatus Bathyarchaeota archaeon]|nr:GNAT family N-acetyltransferase [Candidatus Bathyarchaeota archaeon]
MPKVIVRPYNDCDYRHVVELAVDPLTQSREGAEKTISWASKSEDADVFVADLEGEIVGFIMMEYSKSERWAKIGYIGWIAVHPEHQRKGYGSKLIEAGEESARKMGMRRLYVEPTIKDDYAICFYIMNGLMPEGRRIGYYPDGSDSIILGKKL